ncbi:uncharacterized protein [Clytia hemisphaerica]|uniref:2-hydroxyacyl-CoA lyase 2 n=1 Tax=Clytia hemisphaerica TaxID=252671 RepID=A0A069DMU9_9CNID
MISNAALIYKTFIQRDIKHVFGYTGGAIFPLLDQFYPQDEKNRRIKLVVNSHEQFCGYAAIGYAKASGNTGVAMVTSGPGITNCVTSLLDAQLLISGNVSLEAFGKNSFQESPAVDITKPITKWSHMVEPQDNVDDIINQAFEIANHKKKGAVHIDIPACILNAKVSHHKTTIPDLHSTFINSNFYTPFNSIEDIGKVINSSRRPVIHTGKGACQAYKEVRRFSKVMNIPVVTTLHGVGILDENDRLSLRMGGVYGTVVANYAIQNADCIISIGARFDDRSTGDLSEYAPHCKHFVHLNIDESEINKVVNAKNVIIGDVCLTLPQLMDSMKQLDSQRDPDGRTSWIEEIYNGRSKYPIFTENEYLTAEDILRELNLQLRNRMDKVLVTTGIGNHQMMTCQHLTWTHPQRLITSGSCGAMGTGLPYAIGAQIAFPDHMVIDIDGDGSFLMSIGDLKTVVEEQLPVKIITMNNGCLGMVKSSVRYFKDFEDTVAMKYRTASDFAQIARAFGVIGITCTKDNFQESINQFLNSEGPVLLDCIIENTECFPNVPYGKGLNEMFIQKDTKLIF